MDDIMGYLEVLIAVSLSGFLFLAYFAIWFKRRRQRRLYERQGDDNVEVGSLSDLKRAEDELAGGVMEIRENLLKTHALIGQFPTIRGYSRLSMNALLKKLEGQNVSGQVLFQETLPAGVASAVEPYGVYELYAPYAQAEEAQRLLDEQA